jgi:hypothetical protein
VGRRNRGDRRKALPQDVEADYWVDYCGARMFVVGYTPGGAPYGWVEGTDGSGIHENNDHPQPEEEFIDPPF